jgi:cytochrome c oxidase subunit 2
MIDDLQQPVFAVAGIIGIIVAVVIAYAMWRYKDRGQPIPEQTPNWSSM